jgi:ATP/ADP translocase
LIKIILETVKDISVFSIFLGIFIFTYALIGMAWFAYKVRLAPDGSLDLENGTSPE